MIDAVKNKKIPVKTVWMDSCYPTQRLMALIENLGKIYYCPLKRNRACRWQWRSKKISKTGRNNMEWDGITLRKNY